MRSILIITAAGIALSGISDAEAGEIVGYAYDAQGRLIAADHAGAVNDDVDVDYTYDAANNRTGRTITGVTAMRQSETAEEVSPPQLESPPKETEYHPEDERPL